jgi:4a-hydroxytetrahydrobiopterin dehydratase
VYAEKGEPTMPEKLTPSEIAQHLSRHPEWELQDNGREVRRLWRFENFDQAWDFLEKIAHIARELDHHPRIVNEYGRVELSLTTHDLGGLSVRDFTMIARIENLLTTYASGSKPG